MNRPRPSAAILALVFLVPVLLLGHAGKRPIAEIPLEFDKNLPLASIHVNGAPLTFILDSAAAGCVIDEQAAVAHGIEPSESGVSTGSGGRFGVKLARRVDLRLAGVQVELEYAVVTSLTHLEFQKPVHGIIGSPLFANYVVEIDYRGRTARIYDPERYQPPPSGHVSHVWMADGPTLAGRLKLPGQRPLEAHFQLDTGSAHVLTICKPFVDRHKMLDALKNARTGSTLGLGGRSPDVVARIDSVSVGPYSVENPEVRLSINSTGSFASDRFSANLGSGFLNRYTVIFDLPHSRVILVP